MPSHSRHPYDTERPGHMLRSLFLAHNRAAWLCGSSTGAIHVAGIFNDASNPKLYRSDEEHDACIRIAFLCRRIRANYFGGSTFRDQSDGSWYVNPNRRSA